MRTYNTIASLIEFAMPLGLWWSLNDALLFLLMQFFIITGGSDGGKGGEGEVRDGKLGPTTFQTKVTPLLRNYVIDTHSEWSWWQLFPTPVGTASGSKIQAYRPFRHCAPCKRFLLLYASYRYVTILDNMDSVSVLRGYHGIASLKPPTIHLTRGLFPQLRSTQL